MKQSLMRTWMNRIFRARRPVQALRSRPCLERFEDRLAPAAFTAGNLVIYRVGDGAGNLANTGNAVFLDEYTPSGTLVQSIAMPTTASGANKQLVASGTATSEGLLTLSADNQYIFLTGYASDIPSGVSLPGTTSTTVNRTVGRVDVNGTIDTSTALTDFAAGSNPRSVASTDGTDIWVTGGAGGIRHTTFGSTTSTQISTTVTNLRQVNIFDGQLYISTASGSAVRVGTVGTGTPTTSGQTITNLPGFPTTGSPYGFFFADLDLGVSGVDTLYVASDDAGALTKYSLVSGNWTSNGTVGVAADAYRGLTGRVNGTTVTLFATREGGSGAAGGGEYVSLSDATGYNGAFSGAPTLLATAATNTAFRGVAFAPNTVADLSVTKSGPALSTIGDSVTYTYAVTNTGGTPLNSVSVSDDNGTPGDSGDDFSPTPVLSGGFNVGDINHNGALDPAGGGAAETWQYTATRTIPQGASDPFVNLGSVTASAGGGGVSASDSHSINLFQPDISVQKFGPATAAVGDLVFYTYAVSNSGSGDSPGLTNIVLSDDNGTPGDSGDDFSPPPVLSGSFNIGDGNQNGLLDVGELWFYQQARTILASDSDPLVNTVGVTANPNGFPNVLTDSASFSIDIKNPPPTATDDLFTFTEDTTAGTGNVITNTIPNGADSDPDGDTLTVTSAANSASVAITLGTPSVLPSGATLTINSNGSFTYNASTSATFNALLEGESATDSFTYTISDSFGGSDTATVTITITGVNEKPEVSITANDAAAAEAAGPPNPGQFTVSRTGGTTNPLTVSYTVGGTATNSADYATLSGSVSFAIGQSSAVINVNVTNDLLTEGPETVIVTLAANAAYAVANPTSATVTITDNKPDLTLTKSNTTGGVTTVSLNWVWKLRVANVGFTNAVFTSGQTLAVDNLPTTDISYGAVTFSGQSGVTGTSFLSGSIVAGVLTVKTSGGSVTIAPSTGKFDVNITATPSAAGPFTNPTGAGASVDPGNGVAEVNEGNNAAAADTVNVNAPVDITTTSLPNWTRNRAYNRTIVATAGTGAKTFTKFAGTLPTGLTLNATTGTITGTPTVANTFTFTIKATDTKGAFDTQDYTVVISPAISFSLSASIFFELNKSYTQVVTPQGGTGTLTLSYTVLETPPTGLSISPSSPTTGPLTISGTPTQNKRTVIQITVTDSVGATATLTLKLFPAGWTGPF